LIAKIKKYLSFFVGFEHEFFICWDFLNIFLQKKIELRTGLTEISKARIELTIISKIYFAHKNKETLRIPAK
jgi:hypothetical protein